MDLDIDKITKNLYASDMNSAHIAVELGLVDSVIDLREEAIPELETIFYSEREVEYKHYPCEDGAFIPTDYLDEVINFIHTRVIQRKKVLVHCVAGISRTATVITAYLVVKLGLPPEEAFAYARRRRHVFKPHPNLWSSLSLYCKSKGYGELRPLKYS